MKSFFVIFITWFAAGKLVVLNTYFLPEISGVFISIVDEVQSGGLLLNLFATLRRLVIGLGIGVAFGLPWGIWIGTSPVLRGALMPIIEFIRGIPTSLLFPVFIVAFGIGELSKVIIVAFATFPIILISAVVGCSPRLETIDRREYFHLHKNSISKYTKLLLILWDAVPSIVSGFKVSISIALVLTIVTEMFFVASSGVGWAAYQAYQNFDLNLMYAYIIIVGFLGLFTNWVFDRHTSHFFSTSQKR